MNSRVLANSAHALLNVSAIIMSPECRTHLSFFAVSDDGVLPNDVLAARCGREAISCIRFQEDVVKIADLAAFSRWMHLTHLCYAVGRQPELSHHDTISRKALASY
jgi:hypothetical protein